jgi:CheY-like chemotaxis protein
MDMSSQDLLKYPDLNPGPYLRLTVRDTGQGMDRALMERIFDPYFTTKEKGKGTGLGLSVVLGITKKHGGTVIVQSEPGKGTTFDVYLPRIELSEADQVPTSEPLPKGTDRILFVDDEEALLRMGRQMLERLGYEVSIETNSTKALETFRARPDDFDLVITDMTMPVMTGTKLASELLAIRADIPIVLCTGFSALVTEEKIKAIGIRELVMKPLIMRDLAVTIHKILHGN